VFLEENLPRKAEPVRMNPRTSNTNQTITLHHPIAQNQLPLLAEASCKPDKIKPSIASQQLRDDRCLSPDNRHSRLLGSLDEANSHLLDNRTVWPAHRHVV